MSNPADRHKHLYDRMKEKFSDVAPEKAKNRNLVFNSFLNNGLSPDISVFNDYSEGVFQKSVEKIVDSMFRKKFVKKRSIPKDTNCFICSCYLNKVFEKKVYFRHDSYGLT